MSTAAAHTGSRNVVEALLGTGDPACTGYRWLNLRRSSLLLPVGTPSAAGAALLRRSAKTPGWSIAGRRVLAGALRALGRLDRRPSARGAPAPVVRWFEEVLDQRDLLVVALLGPPRPNDKPVLQVLDRAGTTLAWAKVGWSPLTRRLVEHETQVLTELAGCDPRLRVPRPIASTVIDDCSIALHSALPVWEGARRRSAPEIDWLTTTIARAGTLTTEPFGESAYLERLRHRTALVEPPATRATVSRLVDRLVKELASVPLRCGRWHGDLSPWNLDWQAGQVLVWDWERSEDGIPVGLDAIHYAVQERPSGEDAGVSAHTAAIRYAGPVGQDPFVAPILERAYHLEIFLRREEEQRTASVGADPAAVATLLDRLERFT